MKIFFLKSVSLAPRDYFQLGFLKYEPETRYLQEFVMHVRQSRFEVGVGSLWNYGSVI